jgi:hypothetical protein
MSLAFKVLMHSDGWGNLNLAFSKSLLNVQQFELCKIRYCLQGPKSNSGISSPSQLPIATLCPN